MKLLSAIMVFAMLIGGSMGTALAECTQEEMETKARIVAEKLEKLRTKSESDYRFLLLRFNNKARLLDVNDFSAWCELYDQMMFEM